MVPLVSLWLPILVSAVIVFVLSSIIHMVLPYHRSDYKRLPSEEAALEALRKLDIPPGEYMAPRPQNPKEMNTPEFRKKLEQGPVFIATFWKYTGGMGTQLLQWFVFLLVVSLFAAYLTSRALGPGAPYLEVHRFAGATAFMGYALALWQSSIWYKRPVSTNLKLTFDGLLYALMTGGTFGWLWPK
jgi:hypothetical protein